MKLIIGLIVLASILIIVILSCFIFPRKARKWFLWVFKYFFKRFCIRFICNTPARDMEKIIDRFKENVPDQNYFLASLKEQFHIRRVLDVLNASVSEFQFSIMPSGSLREGFGKLQPSTSALASDFDMMLIPEDCFVELSEDLRLTLGESTSTKRNSGAIFEAIRPSGTDEAFCWLKLREDLPIRHQHWERFVVYKKLNEENNKVLSNDQVRYELKNALVKAKTDLEYYDNVLDILKHGEQEYSYSSNIEINGPAVTIKIQKKEALPCETCTSGFFNCLRFACMASNCLCCCGCCFPLRNAAEEREMYSFYSDFTLAICCRDWPIDSKGEVFNFVLFP